MLSLIKALFFTPGPKYSWKKVILVLIFSSFAISGGATVSYILYRYSGRLQATNAACAIQAIIQTGPKYAPLPTTYLAEVLDLSADYPANLNQFNFDEAYDRLHASCILKQVRLKKIKPDIIYVDYSLREPIAYLEDYTNTAIDCEGALFPYSPFYPPRSLPRVYLGVHAPAGPWGAKIKKEHFTLVKTLMGLLPVKSISRIDLSQVEATSSGQREIVVVLQEGSILRITPKNYVEQLANYSILERIQLQEDDVAHIVDLRIPEIAYLQRI